MSLISILDVIKEEVENVKVLYTSNKHWNAEVYFIRDISLMKRLP